MRHPARKGMSYPTKETKMNDDGMSDTILSYNNLEESIKGMTLEEKLPRLKKYLARTALHPELGVSAEIIEQIRLAVGIYERAANKTESDRRDNVMGLWFLL